MNNEIAKNFQYSPFFLCGALRSGTTLARLVLDGSPAINLPFEGDFMFDSIVDGLVPSGEELWQFLLSNRNFQASELFASRVNTYEQNIDMFFWQMRTRKDAEFVGVTVHRNLEIVAQLFGSVAKFVYIRRDGRNVARSMVQMGMAGNAYQGALQWAEIEESWRLVREWLPPENVLEIYFDDLVINPQGVAHAVGAFLGCDPQDMFDVSQTVSERSTYSNPGKGVAKSWRDSEEGMRDAAIVESVAAPWLSAAGFELSRPVASLTEVDRLHLELDGRIKLLGWRASRYGIPLVVADAVTRRLRGPKIVRKYVMHRMHNIERAHLK